MFGTARTPSFSPLAKTFASLALTLGLVAATPVAAEAATQKTNDTNGYDAGRYFISAWVSGWDYNRGSFTRTWQTSNNGNNLDYLWLNFNQNANPNYVGFDAGAGWNTYGGTKVNRLIDTNKNEVNQGVYYKFQHTISAQGSGFWIQGPKTIISSTQYYSGLDRQYECYIVDSANISSDEIVRRYGLNSQGESKHGGKVYKHYTRTLQAGNDTIYQVFSIRQGYRGNRSTGWTSTNWIMRQWQRRGMVPGHYYNLGWKVNLETDGNFNASNCGWSYLSLPKNLTN